NGQAGRGQGGAVLDHEDAHQGRDRAPVRPHHRPQQPPAAGAQSFDRRGVVEFGAGPLGVGLLGPAAPGGVPFLLRRHPVPLHRHTATSSDSAESTSTYAGVVSISSEWRPTAAIRPSWSSATRSASATVEGRCTTTSAVVSFNTDRKSTRLN